MSAFSDGSFSTSAFSDQAFSFGTPTPTVTVIDTHDGDERRDERFRRQRDAKQRLRDQIRLAIDGPDAALLAPALERFAAKGEGPIEDRVDVGQLLLQAALLREIRESAAAELDRQIEEEDNEILMMI